jgi:hypothetical protein
MAPVQSPHGFKQVNIKSGASAITTWLNMSTFKNGASAIAT